MMTGQFIGVGVGPGDPQLLTMKAWKAIADADVVSYLTNTKGDSQAKHIARDALAEVKKDQIHIPVAMPMLEDRTETNAIYDSAAAEIETHLHAGKNVAFLCEGDPLFFGSFAYLLMRLSHHNCLVIPGVSSFHAASAALQTPLTVLKESFAIASGRQTLAQLETTLKQHESVVVMKAGRARQRILAALKNTNRTQDAQYIEYIGRENEVIVTDVTELADEVGPYFSLFMVTKKERGDR